MKHITLLTAKQAHAQWIRKQKALFNRGTRKEKRIWFISLMRYELQHQRGIAVEAAIWFTDRKYAEPGEFENHKGISMWEGWGKTHTGYSLDYATVLRWLGFSWKKFGL